MILGSLGSLAAWVIGITKGVFVAAQDDFLPKFLAKENKYNAPYVILLIQGIIFSILSISVIILPIQVAFVLLSAVTTQLSLIIYVTLFYAAYLLKKQRPHHDNYFQNTPSRYRVSDRLNYLSNNIFYRIYGSSRTRV